MSQPKSIYETPWMEEWKDNSGNIYFAEEADSELFLCSEELRKKFHIGSTTRIKVALFTERCNEAVQVSLNSPSGRFFVDGTFACFTCEAYSRLMDNMTQHGTNTLYAKYYIEA